MEKEKWKTKIRKRFNIEWSLLQEQKEGKIEDFEHNENPVSSLETVRRGRGRPRKDSISSSSSSTTSSTFEKLLIKCENCHRSFRSDRELAEHLETEYCENRRVLRSKHSIIAIRITTSECSQCDSEYMKQVIESCGASGFRSWGEVPREIQQMVQEMCEAYGKGANVLECCHGKIVKNGDQPQRSRGRPRKMRENKSQSNEDENELYRLLPDLVYSLDKESYGKSNLNRAEENPDLTQFLSPTILQVPQPVQVKEENNVNDVRGKDKEDSESDYSLAFKKSRHWSGRPKENWALEQNTNLRSQLKSKGYRGSHLYNPNPAILKQAKALDERIANSKLCTLCYYLANGHKDLLMHRRVCHPEEVLKSKWCKVPVTGVFRDNLN